MGHSPDDTHLIDAREAFYVVGSNLNGAMGPTLASFANKTDATDFAAEHGGNVLAFVDVTLEHLNNGMTMHDMSGMDDMAGMHDADEAGMADDHISHSTEH